uniref:Uncharacterized protein n=1 Tax=Chromera velia CCMP2878 TaxID=1169474 RepID=A0A0G4HF24_9ALVE|eukprot:Cvel_26952.t1-p1 / transcript=Cvel_26952.t1 / gene=Cvel_26952 / organism=Chromera_velia_CCMP2878 / gene_product=hypothetical protein / transcript_product=hypothetical protein / location=Cvel_scaffold3284:5287-7718(+) / protein_length=275 / sequence_SO=supercontig / SO=protein_coding / is_pseudo=false
MTFEESVPRPQGRAGEGFGLGSVSPSSAAGRAHSDSIYTSRNADGKPELPSLEGLGRPSIEVECMILGVNEDGSPSIGIVYRERDNGETLFDGSTRNDRRGDKEPIPFLPNQPGPVSPRAQGAPPHHPAMTDRCWENFKRTARIYAVGPELSTRYGRHPSPVRFRHQTNDVTLLQELVRTQPPPKTRPPDPKRPPQTGGGRGSPALRKGLQSVGGVKTQTQTGEGGSPRKGATTGRGSGGAETEKGKGGSKGATKEVVQIPDEVIRTSPYAKPLR